jgi:hypothetical protein
MMLWRILIGQKLKGDREMKIKSILKMLVVLFALTISVAPLLGCGCLVEEEQAIQAMTNFGFTDVKVESRFIFFVQWQGCSKSDAVGFHVNGMNAQGKRIKMIVCVGWPFKGATVRSL